MKELINKPWSYTFFEDDNKYFLSVLCGSSALFEINLILEEEETALYNTFGEDYIESLAINVKEDPSKYSDRNTTF